MTAGIGLAVLGLYYASGALSGPKTAGIAALLALGGTLSVLQNRAESEAEITPSADRLIVSESQAFGAAVLPPDGESTPSHMVSLRILYATTTGTAKGNS